MDFIRLAICAYIHRDVECCRKMCSVISSKTRNFQLSWVLCVHTGMAVLTPEAKTPRRYRNRDEKWSSRLGTQPAEPLSVQSRPNSISPHVAIATLICFHGGNGHTGGLCKRLENSTVTVQRPSQIVRTTTHSVEELSRFRMA